MSRTSLAMQANTEKPGRVKSRDVQAQLREISSSIASRTKIATKSAAGKIEAEAFGGKGEERKRESR